MTIYVLGGGAIGLSLTAHLANGGRQVILGRTRNQEGLRGQVTIRLHTDQGDVAAQVDTASLAKLRDIDGLIVVTAKAYANQAIADQLKAKETRSPIIVMQNGIGVEDPFRQAGFSEIYRCVLYSGAQKTGACETRFKSIGASPIGIIEGNEETLHRCVEQLNTPSFPFRAEPGIQTEIWKKGIINSVFNTICPLLEADSGVFFRDRRAAELSKAIISECVEVTKALGIDVSTQALMDTVLAISRGMEGQFVSTLQDVRAQSETEIGSLNLAIARIADALTPKVDVRNTRLLGELIRIKASMIEPDQSETPLP